MIRKFVLFLAIAQVLTFVSSAPAGKEKTWTSGIYSPNKHMRLGLKDGKAPIVLEQRAHVFDAEIPSHFDAREKWPYCIDVIGNIRDQSDCGSCWAVAAASVFSDRKCISSGGKVLKSFSAEDTLACCTLGGSEGCDGGWPASAWTWLVETGVVSGGNFTNRDGCRPYLFCPPGARWQCWTPNCRKTCDGSMPKDDYQSDKHHASTSFEIKSKDVSSMQKELMQNGSLEVSFTVYQDFYNYTGGVYQRTPHSKKVGGHAVRLIGWGVDNGVDYWLIANSWGYDWGEKGYFRIVRGVNECGIEEEPVAGDVPPNS